MCHVLLGRRAALTGQALRLARLFQFCLLAFQVKLWWMQKERPTDLGLGPAERTFPGRALG